MAASPSPLPGSLPDPSCLTLALAGTKTTVDVQATAAILEVDPSAHVDADHSRIAKIPAFDPRGSLSQAITYSTALHSFSWRYEAPLATTWCGSSKRAEIFELPVGSET